MYQVLNNNRVSYFNMFIDAWLFAVLDCKSFAKISGPEVDLIINPKESN